MRLDVWKLQISGRYNWTFKKMVISVGPIHSSCKEPTAMTQGKGSQSSRVAFNTLIASSSQLGMYLPIGLNYLVYL